MSGERELAEIYARQANRASRAAITVGLGGTVAVGALAITLASGSNQGGGAGILLAVLGVTLALTTALYAWVSGMSAQAQAQSVRHLVAALAAEAESGAGDKGSAEPAL